MTACSNVLFDDAHCDRLELLPLSRRATVSDDNNSAVQCVLGVHQYGEPAEYARGGLRTMVSAKNLDTSSDKRACHHAS